MKKSHDLIPALVSLLCNRQLEIGQPLPIIKKLMPVVGDTSELRPCHHTRSAMSLLFHVRRAMLTRCSFPSGGAKEGGEPEANLQGPPLSNMSYC